MNNLQQLKYDIESRLNDFEADVLTKEETIESFAEYLAGLIERVKEQLKPQWTKDKPDFPCVFIAKVKHKNWIKYITFTIKYEDNLEGEGQYLALFNDYDNEEPLDELFADEYFVIEKLGE